MFTMPTILPVHCEDSSRRKNHSTNTKPSDNCRWAYFFPEFAIEWLYTITRRLLDRSTVTNKPASSSSSSGMACLFTNGHVVSTADYYFLPFTLNFLLSYSTFPVNVASFNSPIAFVI